MQHLLFASCGTSNVIAPRLTTVYEPVRSQILGERRAMRLSDGSNSRIQKQGNRDGFSVDVRVKPMLHGVRQAVNSDQAVPTAGLASSVETNRRAARSWTASSERRIVSALAAAACTPVETG